MINTMRVASNILRCLLVSATFCYYACGHRCVHDKIASQATLQKINLEEATRQRSNRAAVRSYGAIRIVTHIIHKYVSKRHRSRLLDKDGPIHLAASQIGRVLRVKRLPQLAFPLQCSKWLGSGACLYNHVIPMKCGTSPKFDIPLDHMRQMRVCHDSTETNCTTIGGGGILSADLVIYLTAIDYACSDSAIAYASHCALDTSNGNRPIAGVINICPKNFWKNTSNTEYQYRVLLHELTHILAFSNQLYPHFVHAQGSGASSVARRSFYNGQEIAKIITPNVVAWGRHFFNCDKLEGVMLQPPDLIGWLGSHWNHLLLEEEYMSPGINRITGEVKLISNFTLALLQDSGWYQVDYNVTRMWKQPSKFKGAGCATIESCPMPCPSSDNQHTGCSHDGLASAVYNKYSLTMKCATYQAFPDYSCTDVTSKTLANHNRRYEVLGNQSRCFVLTSTVGPNIERYGHCLQHQCYQLSHTHLYALKVFLPTRSAPYCHGNGNSTYSKKYNGVWCREGVELKLPNHYGNITCPRAAHYCSHSNNIIDIEDVPPSLCDDSCATCFKPYDPAQCTSCYHGYKLNGNFTANCLQNHTKCWGANYHDNTTNSCESCPEGCAICSTSTDCQKCSNYTHYLANQLIAAAKCVPSCEEVGLLSYINSTNQRRYCYVCSDVNCVSCDITGRCSDCRSPYQLYNGSCVLRCPSNTIGRNNKCHGCPRHCQQCHSEQECSRCESGYQLAAGFCVVRCPSTFYSVNSTHCDECSEGCAYCKQFSNCLLCNTGYNSYRHGCVKQCPSGYLSTIDPTKRQLYCRACDQLERLFKICT